MTAVLGLVLLGLWVLAGWSLLYQPLREARRTARERAGRLREMREEQSRLVERLRDAEARLAAARTAPAALAGTVSRDLRGTADAMVGLSDLLCRASLPPVPARYARALKQAGGGLLALVDDLTQYAECATDPIRVTPGLLRLEAVVHAARDQALARASGRYAELPVRWEAEPPAQLLGDARLLGHAIRALLAHGLGRGAAAPVLAVVEEAPARWAFRLEEGGTAAGLPEDPGAHGVRELRRSLLQRLVAALGGTLLPAAGGQPGGFILPLVVPAGLPPELEFAPPAPGVRVLVHGVDTLASSDCRASLEAAGLRVVETPPFAAPAETLIEAAASERPIRAVVLVAEHADGRIAPAVEACRRGAWPPVAVVLLLPPGAVPVPGWAEALGLHGVLPWPLPDADLVAALGLALQRVERGLAAPLITPAVLAEARAVAARRGSVEPGAPVRALHALVVDDAEASRLVASEYLAGLGCVVEQAASGPEAVERVRLGGVDVVFLDLMMPGQDGFATARQLQALPGGPGAVPVVALTADALPAVRDRCLAAGMVDHLAKPVRPEDLARVLHGIRPAMPVPAAPGADDFLGVSRRVLRQSGAFLREHDPASASAAVEELLPVARGLGAREVSAAADELLEAGRAGDVDAAWSAHAALERAVAERVQLLRDEEPLDPVRLAEYRALEDRSPGLFAELVRIALKDLPGRVAMLGEALHADEPGAVLELAHGLKGAAMQIGAGRVAGIARELEQMGREGTVVGARERGEELQLAWEQARCALAALPEVAQAPVGG